jgi:hypothetical protein
MLSNQPTPPAHINNPPTAAQTLASDPPLRRLVLADNGIGLEGAAALAEALRTNATLQVGLGG